LTQRGGNFQIRSNQLGCRKFKSEDSLPLRTLILYGSGWGGEASKIIAPERGGRREYFAMLICITHAVLGIVQADCNSFRQIETGPSGIRDMCPVARPH